MSKTIERQLLELMKKYDGRPCNWKITLYSDLKNKLSIPDEEAGELIEEYFNLFNIEPTNFDFLAYYPNEGSFLWPNFLIPKAIRPTGKKPKPLTVKMLIKSAKAGRWLYD